MIDEIRLEKLKNHPKNVRKSYDGIEELADSIKAQGILQNLTVVPDPEEDGMYLVVIGNRRLMAARAAGLETAPCYISNMDEKEQVSVMLLENIQRNDLTIYEQAQGFQMVLDLGETEDTLSQKTGFSKTTIRHRLNIAKLNQKELQKKEKDESFQLTLKDLYELEKIKDIKTRNRILKESYSSRDLVSRAHNAVAEEKRKSCENVIVKMLEKMGVTKAPDNAINELWNNKWKSVKEYDLDKEPPKQIKVPKGNEKMYWLVSYRMLKVIVKVQNVKKELSDFEKKKKEKEKSKKQIKAILKECSARRKELIHNIISGKIDPVEDEKKEIDLVWQAMLPLHIWMSDFTLRKFFIDKEVYQWKEEDKQEVDQKIQELSTLQQMLIGLNEAMDNAEAPFDYNLRFAPGKGNNLLRAYEALEPYGWYFENEDEKKILDGTHELYVKEKTK